MPSSRGDPLMSGQLLSTPQLCSHIITLEGTKMSPDDDVVVVVGQYHPWLRTAAETGLHLPDLESGATVGCSPPSKLMQCRSPLH